jgi:hypothetical protein
MGAVKKTRKFAQMKRLISKRDDRLKHNQLALAEKQKKPKEGDDVVRAIPQVSSSLFFQCTLQHYDTTRHTQRYHHTVYSALSIMAQESQKKHQEKVHKANTSSQTTPPSNRPTPSLSTPTSSRTPCTTSWTCSTP